MKRILRRVSKKTLRDKPGAKGREDKMLQYDKHLQDVTSPRTPEDIRRRHRHLRHEAVSKGTAYEESAIESRKLHVNPKKYSLAEAFAKLHEQTDEEKKYVQPYRGKKVVAVQDTHGKRKFRKLTSLTIIAPRASVIEVPDDTFEVSDNDRLQVLRKCMLNPGAKYHEEKAQHYSEKIDRYHERPLFAQHDMELGIKMGKRAAHEDSAVASAELNINPRFHHKQGLNPRKQSEVFDWGTSSEGYISRADLYVEAQVAKGYNELEVWRSLGWSGRNEAVRKMGRTRERKSYLAKNPAIRAHSFISRRWDRYSIPDRQQLLLDMQIDPEYAKYVWRQLPLQVRHEIETSI